MDEEERKNREEEKVKDDWFDHLHYKINNYTKILNRIQAPIIYLNKKTQIFDRKFMNELEKK
jgi:hypothetical protein